MTKHEQSRRSATEPMIARPKTDGYLGRGYLKGYAGAAANAIPTLTTFASLPG